MKTTFYTAIATMFLATATQAEVYQCEFNPRLTRGWAPKNMYVDRTKGLVYMWDREEKVTGTAQKMHWRSSDGYKMVRYTLTIGDNIEAGEQVRSYLNIAVKGTQQESSSDKCQLYTG